MLPEMRKEWFIDGEYNGPNVGGLYEYEQEEEKEDCEE